MTIAEERMTSERFQRIEHLVLSTLELAPDERGRMLSAECDGDDELRREVESLLRFQNEAEDFISKPAVAAVASTLADGELYESVEGQQLGSYRLIKELGHGGMGTVYLAERADEYQKQVAIKAVKRGLATHDLVTRLRSERQILANLDHPSIAKLLDGGTLEDGSPYIVMDYVEGVPIDSYCDRHQLSIGERLQLFRKVCAAVAFAHRNLVIHRDLKPSNIIVATDGTPRLLDFGIAKVLDPNLQTTGDHTATVARIMTPQYASPEQIRGLTVTTSSDIYSLGVLLYKLLSGHLPYQLKSLPPIEIERAVCEKEPERPSTAATRGREETRASSPQFDVPNPKLLRGDLDNIVLMAMRKEPERRYSSADQFSEDLRRYLDGLPVIARKDTLSYRALKFAGRNRIGVAVAVVVLLMSLVGVAMIVKEKRRADRRFADVRHLANSLLFEADTEIQKGPTKARAMIVRRALEYLGLAQETGNDAGLQLELANGYLIVGDIQGKPYRPNLGDTAGALASYRKAQTLLESLVAVAPNNLEARRSLSLSYQSIGRLQQRDGDCRNALESERKAIQLSEALSQADSANAQYRSLLADNYLHFGEALYNFDCGGTIEDHHQAIEYFRKALSIHLKLTEKDPDNTEFRHAAGVDYEYVGIAFNRLGDLTGDATNYEAALENHLKEKDINEALAATDPTNVVYRRILADVYGEVGLSLLKLHRYKEALENFRPRIRIFEELRASDATNVEARRDLANAYREMGEAMEDEGDTPGALKQERESAAILEALHEAEPGNSETLGNLIRLYEVSGDIAKKAGDFNAALEAYQKARALLEAWTTTQVTDASVRRMLTIEYANVAGVHEASAASSRLSKEKRLADLRAAREWFQRSLAGWQDLKAHSDLNQADRTRLTDVTNRIARIDAALAR